jgi:hypothetical protein
LPEPLLDNSEDTFDVRQNIVIPEAHHTITLRTQIAISRLVACRLCMLPAIDFDDHQLSPANEVADIGAYGLLPDELISTELPVTNAIPERRFGVGLVYA